MNYEEFKECFKKLRDNFDKFSKEEMDNIELIQNYILITEQLIKKLDEEKEIIKKYENSNIIEIWRKHIIENSRYGYRNLTKKIEELINEFDETLREDIKKLEEDREEILKLNKKA